MQRSLQVGVVALLLALVASSVSRSAAETGKNSGSKVTQPSRELVIRVPSGIDHERLLVLVGVYGQGLGLGPARKLSATEYVQRLPQWTTSVKLLIYHPNYKVIAAMLTPRDISSEKPFVPKFEKAKMIPLKVRVVDSGGRPLAGFALELGVNLYEMDYFNYLDGMVYGGDVDKVVTNSSGEFSTGVPSLLDDPYFAKRSDLSVELRPSEGTRHSGTYGYDSLPRGIPAQRSYSETLTRTVVYKGHITGKIEKSFLARNGVRPSGNRNEGPSLMVRRHGDTGSSGRGLGEHGSFEMTVSAGTYDLTLECREGKQIRSVAVMKDVVVGEGENKAVTIR